MSVHRENREKPPEGRQERPEVFSLSCERYTLQMWIDDMDRLGGFSKDAGSPYSIFLRWPLHTAAASGRTDIVQFIMLSKGCDMDSVDDEGYTPLLHAALMGHRAVVEALLAEGADVSVRTNSGKSALDMAFAKGHVDIGRAIIDYGADVNAADARRFAPLHYAVVDKNEMMSLLLERGADVNVLDGYGQTPLHHATAGGYTGATRALLAAGADATLRCREGTWMGWSALDIAVAKGLTDIAIMILTHGVDVNPPGGNGPLHIAAQNGNAEVVPLLSAKGANADHINGQGYTPLVISAGRGHVAVTRALLAAGAKAGFRMGHEGWSALDMAASEGHVQNATAIIEHGVDVNNAAGDGSTPLHNAAERNKPATIDVLVRAGADIEQEDDGGATPLHIAAYESALAAVLALLKHGASVNKQDTEGDTPLHYAALNAGTLGTAEVVDLLLRWGADENITANNGKAAADVVGSRVYRRQGKLAEDVERVRQLLANAPADRAWRRRGFLVLCRAHYPGGRVQLGHGGSSHAHDTGIAKRICSTAGASKAESEWAGVASMLMGVGADPVSRMGEESNIIFETVMAFL